MEKTIIEINGIKLEVDLRTAKRVEHHKVGDPIKVLVKSYGDSYKSHVGIIVGFDEFVKLPTITIMYVDLGYSNAEVKFLSLNAESKDIELAPMDTFDELTMKKTEAISHLLRNIEKKKLELQEAEVQLQEAEVQLKIFNSFIEKLDLKVQP